MLNETNYNALNSNIGIDFDAILNTGNSQTASMQQQIAGCIYLASCIEADLAVRNDLEERMAAPNLTEQQKQEYNAVIGTITDKFNDLTISFGNASITVDINNMDAYDFLLKFLKFVANNASIYLM